IAPLVRMNVVPTGGVLQSDRTPYPVSGEGNGVPGLSGSQLLLPDIVRQPATIDADTSAENQGIDGCPVHQVAVIPVIDTGADNHRTFAASVFSGRRPIPRQPNDVVARQSSVFFRPGGSIGSSLVIVIFGIGSRQASRDPILSHQEVVDRSYEDRAADGFHPLGRNSSQKSIPFGKVIQFYQHLFIRLSEKGQGGLNLRTVLAIFEQQVPLTLLLSPAMSYSSLRHLGSLIPFVPHQELPITVFFLSIRRESVRSEELARPVMITLPVQFHQEWCIGVSLRVIQEVGRSLYVVELLQENMVDCHPPGSILTGVDRHPFVGILGDLAEVG